MPARFPIHVPYLVGVIRAETPEETEQTVNAMMEELHRYLRYLQDSNDNTQTTLEEIGGDGPGSVPTLAEVHARIMIRESLGW